MQYTKNILCVDDKYWTLPTTILKNVLPFPGGRLGAHCLKGIIIFPAITGKFPVIITFPAITGKFPVIIIFPAITWKFPELKYSQQPGLGISSSDFQANCSFFAQK